jgi:hypothetical protein
MSCLRLSESCQSKVSENLYNISKEASMSFNAVLGFVTWFALLITAIHSIFLRKKLGAGSITLHIADILTVFVVATIHGTLIMTRIIANGWPLQLGSILGLTTWSLVFITLMLGIFRKPLASILKQSYMVIHMIVGYLAFAFATYHGITILLGQLAKAVVK